MDLYAPLEKVPDEDLLGEMMGFAARSFGRQPLSIFIEQGWSVFNEPQHAKPDLEAAGVCWRERMGCCTGHASHAS